MKPDGNIRLDQTIEAFTHVTAPKLGGSALGLAYEFEDEQKIGLDRDRTGDLFLT